MEPRPSESTMLRYEETESANDEGIVLAKVTAMVVLSLATFILGMLPTKLATWFKWGEKADGGLNTSKKSQLILSLLLCFGGGALLCTTFLHMLPEVREVIEELQASGEISSTDFHLTELIMCCGFFIMYFIEELVHLYLHWREDSKGVSKEDEVLHRSFSLRKCSSHKNKEGNKTESDSQRQSIDTSTEKIIPDYPSVETITTLVENDKTENYYETVPPPGKLQTTVEIPYHSHSHVQVSDPIVASVRGLLVVLALSIHELFEGLAVGLQTSTGFVWYMLGAVSAHKLVIAFCVGVELVSSRTKYLLTLVYITTFALVSPVGIGIGLGLTDSSGDSVQGGVPNAILQGMATGTLLYVVFFEVLQKQRASKESGIMQLLAIIVGFGIMFGLLNAVGHSHAHGDDDHHHEEHSENVLSVVRNLTGNHDHDHDHHHHH